MTPRELLGPAPVSAEPSMGQMPSRAQQELQATVRSLGIEGSVLQWGRNWPGRGVASVKTCSTISSMSGYKAQHRSFQVCTGKIASAPIGGLGLSQGKGTKISVLEETCRVPAVPLDTAVAILALLHLVPSIG